MAEPLSLVAGLVGVTSAALQTAQALKTYADHVTQDYNDVAPGYTVVLNFRQLQAKRIEEMQNELILLSAEKYKASGGAAAGGGGGSGAIGGPLIPPTEEEGVQSRRMNGDGVDAEKGEAGIQEGAQMGERVEAHPRVGADVHFQLPERDHVTNHHQDHESQHLDDAERRLHISKAQKAEVLLNEKIDAALKRYAQALRDFETLGQEEIPDNPQENKWYYQVARPFGSYGLYISIFFDLITRLLRLLTPKHTHKPRSPHGALSGAIEDSNLTRRKTLLEKLPGDPLYARQPHFRELDKANRLRKERAEAFSERLWLGSFGGVALIGPMLLMVLHYDRNTTVITASVATFLFVLVLAFGAPNLKGQDVLAATAGYAAVLVVFVGTSISTPVG